VGLRGSKNLCVVTVSYFMRSRLYSFFRRDTIHVIGSKRTCVLNFRKARDTLTGRYNQCHLKVRVVNTLVSQYHPAHIPPRYLVTRIIER
jgi:hypothetical protein